MCHLFEGQFQWTCGSGSVSRIVNEGWKLETVGVDTFLRVGATKGKKNGGGGGAWLCRE